MPFIDKYRSEAQRANDRKIADMNKARALFHTADEFMEKFESYLKDQDDTFKTRPPSFSRFADWLGQPRKSVYSYVGKWPDAERTVRAMIADVIVEHTIIGEYRDAPGIFTLKNVSNWTDKKESIATTKPNTIATPDEARSNIKKIKESLGFDDHGRPGRIGKKNVADLEGRIIQLAEAQSE
jgi:hypothetical protein